MPNRDPPRTTGVINVAQQPMYSKHAYPKVSGSRPSSATTGSMNATGGAGGMLYLEEFQTEAEIEMHNLWLAKRQQEVNMSASYHNSTIKNNDKCIIYKGI